MLFVRSKVCIAAFNFFTSNSYDLISSSSSSSSSSSADFEENEALIGPEFENYLLVRTKEIGFSNQLGDDDDDDDDHDHDDNNHDNTQSWIDRAKSVAIDYVKRFGPDNAEQIFMIPHPLVITYKDYFQQTLSSFKEQRVLVQRDVVNFVFLPKHTISFTCCLNGSRFEDFTENDEVVLDADYYQNVNSIFQIRSYSNFRVCIVPFDTSSPVNNLVANSLSLEELANAAFKTWLGKLLKNVIYIIFFFLLVFEKYIDQKCREAAYLTTSELDRGGRTKEKVMNDYCDNLDIFKTYVKVEENVPKPYIETVVEDFVELKTTRSQKPKIPEADVQAQRLNDAMKEFEPLVANKSLVFVKYLPDLPNTYRALVTKVDKDKTVDVSFLENVLPEDFRNSRLAYCLANVLLCDSFWQMVRNSNYKYPSKAEVLSYFVDVRHTWYHLNLAYFNRHKLETDSTFFASFNDSCRRISESLLFSNDDSIKRRVRCLDQLYTGRLTLDLTTINAEIVAAKNIVSKSDLTALPPTGTTYTINSDRKQYRVKKKSQTGDRCEMEYVSDHGQLPKTNTNDSSLVDDYFYRVQEYIKGKEIPYSVFQEHVAPWTAAKVFDPTIQNGCYSSEAKRKLIANLDNWNQSRGSAFQFANIQINNKIAKKDEEDDAATDVNAKLESRSLQYNNLFVVKTLKKLFPAFDRRPVDDGDADKPKTDYERAVMQLKRLLQR